MSLIYFFLWLCLVLMRKPVMNKNRFISAHKRWTAEIIEGYRTQQAGEWRFKPEKRLRM